MARFFNVVFLLSCVVSLSTSLWSCDGDTPSSPIPNVPVNLQIDLNDPQYLDLNPYGGYMVFESYGNRGIVVYHNFDDSYVCFDLTCAYEPSRPCSSLEIDDSGLNLRCGETLNDGTFENCCNSVYTWDGFPIAGEAQFPLRDYDVFRNGNLLTIRNN